MSVELSGKPDAWKLARPVWGWGRGEIPRPTPRAFDVSGQPESSPEYGSHAARLVFGPTEAPTDEAAEWRSTRSSPRR